MDARVEQGASHLSGESLPLGASLELFAKQQMREVWRTRVEIAPHVARRDTF